MYNIQLHNISCIWFVFDLYFIWLQKCDCKDEWWVTQNEPVGQRHTLCCLTKKELWPAVLCWLNSFPKNGPWIWVLCSFFCPCLKKRAIMFMFMKSQWHPINFELVKVCKIYLNCILGTLVSLCSFHIIVHHLYHYATYYETKTMKQTPWNKNVMVINALHSITCVGLRL